MSERKYWSLAFVLVLGLSVTYGVMFARDIPIVPIAILGLLIFLVILVMCLRDVRLGALLLIFSLPFERIPSLQIGVATVRLSQIVLIALAVALLFKALIKRTDPIKLSPYLPIYTLFVIALINSFWQMEVLSRGVLVFVFILFTSLAMWVIPAALTSKQAVLQAIKTLFWVTIIICLFGFYQYVGDVIGCLII